jgi:hypothetical protein
LFFQVLALLNYRFIMSAHQCSNNECIASRPNPFLK